MDHIKSDKLKLLRRKMWEANQAGVNLRVMTDYVERLSGPPPSFKRRTDDLLGFIISKAQPVTTLVPISTNMSKVAQAITVVWIDDPNELRFYIEYLAERGFVKAGERGAHLDVQLRPAAFIYRETELKQALSVPAALWPCGSETKWEIPGSTALSEPLPMRDMRHSVSTSTSM
ncbi:hypothetical protein DC522_06410 [Microvirga sp. KLBC 81]|uniref:hypothetical protein n=1 Tax=Microvirga sp. KLBC 81 TaxID=1862707 RepID=UPI000D50EA84|nr:hypothetical protein [Microvirga sp. KLBC 81]PVE25166.1 hypothetical protein DC522_06410 [Microvirga sp. KLBC 81]